MNNLRLVHANQNRTGGSWSPDDFDVILSDTGETVGRIYARTSVGMGKPDWWWGLAFPHTLNARQPFFGLSESKPAAKAAFAERWRSAPPTN